MPIFYVSSKDWSPPNFPETICRRPCLLLYSQTFCDIQPYLELSLSRYISNLSSLFLKNFIPGPIMGYSSSSRDEANPPAHPIYHSLSYDTWTGNHY